MKRILITGVTGGLGRAVADLCLAKSFHVTGLFHSNEKAVEAIRKKNSGVDLKKVDLSNLSETEAAAKKISENSWDAFIHLAAAPLELSPVMKQTWASFELQWRIMVQSGVVLTQALLPGMRQSGRGHLIYCLSALTVGSVPKGMASYATAKYGLMGFVNSVAAECAGSGISVNTISPGPMDTDLLKNLPEVAKSQLKKSAPSGEFLDTRVIAADIVALLSL
jgi:NAD(P)-dependent dehydrogenase (short-subunit alcohol dehydrogenase family)